MRSMHRSWLAFLCCSIACGGNSRTSTDSQEDAPKPRTEEKTFNFNIPCEVDVSERLAYAPQSERQVLSVFVRKHRPAKRLPVIVWIHGGGWAGGSRYSVDEWALAEVCRGYAVVSVDYRLSWEAPFPAQLEDVKNAIRFLKKNAWKYHLDSQRMAVWGASAGGHLASLTGMTGDFGDPDITELHKYSARVNVVVAWWAPSNFLTIADQWPTHCAEPRDVEVAESMESRLVGCPIDICKDAARAASPVRYVREDLPPFLLMAGGQDCTVPAAQSNELHQALKTAGNDAMLHIFPSAGHGGNEWSRDYILRKVRSFLDEHLRGSGRRAAGPDRRRATPRRRQGDMKSS